MSLDTKTIKKTNKKLVISGDMIELYLYEKPLFYNFPNEKKDYKKESKNQEERRYFSIKRSRDKIRRLCNANAYAYPHKPKFLTLTFKEEITDLKEARKYYSKFIRKIKSDYPTIKYLGVAEIQKNRYQKYGKKVWHFHIIFFNLPFIYGIKKYIRNYWTYGFIKINAIDHVKNVGAYVSKYLRKDLYEKELIGEKSFFVSRGLIQPKMFRRPTNVNNYIKSNNLVVQYQDEYDSDTHGKIIYKVFKNDSRNSKRPVA